MKINSILVTGGAGFIGSHLCKALKDKGYRVTSLDNYSVGSRDNHHDGIEYIEGETRNISQVLSDDYDLVFHLGEYSRVEQSFDDVKQVLESNICGTLQVIEFCRDNNCKLIYAGSSTKFADGGLGKDQSPYAWTKSTNTELVKNYGEWFGLEYAITYFYNVYGPGERSDAASGTVIAIFADKHKKNIPLEVRRPGTQRRNFTHVKDIVEGLILVGEKGKGDEYGLGHSQSYSILEVADMFGSKIIMSPERPGNRYSSSVDLNRAHLELDWIPKNNLPEYIERLKNF